MPSMHKVLSSISSIVKEENEEEEGEMNSMLSVKVCCLSISELTINICVIHVLRTADTYVKRKNELITSLRSLVFWKR